MGTIILLYLSYCFICLLDEYGIVFFLKGIFLLLMYTIGVPIMFVIMIVLELSRKIFCKKEDK